MSLCALLLCCVLVLLSEQLSVKPPPGQNVQLRPTLPRALTVQIEVDAPNTWSLSVGDAVEIRCVLTTDSHLEETEMLSLHLVLRTPRSVEILPAQRGFSRRGISYTLNPVSLKHSGLYSCGGGTTHPDITVDDTHRFIWVNDSSAAVSLQLLSVHRVRYFYGKTLTIGCQLLHDGSEWKIMSASEKTGRITKCPNQERSGDLLSCTISSHPLSKAQYRKYDPFWCESSTRHKSNVLNVTEAEGKEQNGREMLAALFKLTSPWFVKEGDSVNFQCDLTLSRNNNSDKFDLQLIWTKMGPDNDMTVLLSQRASKAMNYTLTNITHEHSGVYSCWDDGTLSDILILPYPHHFIWVQDDSPPVTINILSHNRTQFFHNEQVTMGCQLPLDQSQWKIKGFDKWTGMIKECDEAELSSSGLLSCAVKMGSPWTDYLFWCESTTGQKSNVLNMTNTVGFDVLEAPPLPVMEGDDFTLRCLLKNKTTGEITAAPAFFRHNSRIFTWSDDGSVTLKNVTKQDEGVYSCQLEHTVATLDTYVTVKARPQEQKRTGRTGYGTV